jgi:tRNA pseudouridine55 synthase
MFGILNINKRTGWTSRDVVNRVHRFVRPAKAGHAGTLDPLATGVLIVAIGQATRLVEYAHRLPKFYRATFQLGCHSPSEDVDTEVQQLEQAPVPSLLQIESALPSFTGVIQQRPPTYSAIHVEGQRSYKLARRGESVELPARPVTIHSLQLVRYEYPALVLDIHCGSGTYVRALGRDLAESLETAAVMSALERKSIGSLDVSTAVDVDDIEERVKQLLLPTRPMIDAISSISLSDEELVELHHGRRICRDEERIEPPRWPDEHSSRDVAGIDPTGRVVSILRATPEGEFRPLRNFPLSD